MTAARRATLTVAAPLPKVCLKCGTHDDLKVRRDIVRKQPIWTIVVALAIVALALFLAGNATIALLFVAFGAGNVIAFSSSSMELDLPLCTRCDRRWNRYDLWFQLSGLWFLLDVVWNAFFAFWVFVQVGPDRAPALMWFTLSCASAFVPLAIVVIWVRRGRTLWAVRMDEVWVTLGGVDPRAAAELESAPAAPPADPSADAAAAK